MVPDEGCSVVVVMTGLGNPEFANLPRKFNVCFVGSKELYEHPDINDIAYYPAKNAAGEMVHPKPYPQL